MEPKNHSLQRFPQKYGKCLLLYSGRNQFHDPSEHTGSSGICPIMLQRLFEKRKLLGGSRVKRFTRSRARTFFSLSIDRRERKVMSLSFSLSSSSSCKTNLRFLPWAVKYCAGCSHTSRERWRRMSIKVFTSMLFAVEKILLEYCRCEPGWRISGWFGLYVE